MAVRDYISPMSSLLTGQADFSHTYTVLNEDLNGYGIMHGGRMLTLCDEVSYVAAKRHAGCDCLTRAVHRARFHQAAKLGETIQIHAKVGLTGNTSLWVAVKIAASGRDKPIMDAVFVFAAVDEQRRPKPITKLIPHSAEDQELYQKLCAMREQQIGLA